MSLSQSTVLKLYHSVIEDVVSGVRESFLDDGVDEQVLQELKQIWESKLQSSKAVEHNPEPPEPQAMGSILRTTGAKLGGIKKNSGTSADSTEEQGPNQTGFSDDQSGGSVRTEPLYPVQITLPAQQGSTETGSRVLTIHVPESAITGNQLQTVLTGPVIGATLALPTALAASLLQQHVNAALRGQQTGGLIASRPFNVQDNNTTSQVDGPFDVETIDSPSGSMSSVAPVHTLVRTGLFKFSIETEGIESNKKLRPETQSSLSQLDGGIDTSDDDDDEDDDDDDVEDEDEDKDEEPEYLEGAVEEEPLNSGDDVSDEDVNDLFDTDNVVVCQYDKITRSRNKWKFYLKDGIMNLAGKDFVFQRSNGDAEWIIEILLWTLLGEENLCYWGYPTTPTYRLLWKIVYHYSCFQPGTGATLHQDHDCQGDINCFMDHVEHFLELCAPTRELKEKFKWYSLSREEILKKIYCEDLLPFLRNADLKKHASILSSHNDILQLQRWQDQGFTAISWNGHEHFSRLKSRFSWCPQCCKRLKKSVISY